MKKRTKSVVILVALVLIVTLVAGCTSAEKSPAPETTKAEEPTQEAVETSSEEGEAPEVEEVTITIWHNFGADVESPYFDDTILPAFMELNNHIKVDVVAQGGDQYRELLITNIAAETTPDLARIDGTHMAGFAKEGALAPLEGLDGFEEVKSWLFEGCVSSCLYNGSYYGLPLGTNCKAAVMDMDVMGELGFTEPPATIEELIDAAKANKSGEFMISVSTTGYWDMLPYFWLFGGEISDENYTTTTGYINSEASIKAVEKLIELNDEKVFTIRDKDGTPDAWDGIRNDVYAMFIEGPWFWSCVPEWKELNLTPAQIPTYNGKSASIIGGESIVMFDTCENRDAAFALMRYLLQEDTQLEMAENMGKIPVNTAAAGSEFIQGDEVLKAYVEQLYTAKARIPSPASSSIEEAFQDEFTMMFNKEIGVKEGLDELAVLLDEILAEQ